MALDDASVSTILLDVSDLDFLTMSGLLYLADVISLCSRPGKIKLLVSEHSQPDTFMRAFAHEEMYDTIVTPRPYTPQDNHMDFNYIESSDPLFNAAQFELIGATANYKVSLNVRCDDPLFDALAAGRCIGDAIARKIKATQGLEDARENMAKNLINEIEAIVF